MQNSYFNIIFDPRQYQKFRLDHYEIEIEPWYQSDYKDAKTTLKSLRFTMSSAKDLNPSIMEPFSFTTVLQSVEMDQTVRVGKHFFNGHPADIKISLQNPDTENSTLFEDTKRIQLFLDVIEANDGIRYSVLP